MGRERTRGVADELNGRVLGVFLAVCDAGSMNGAALAVGVTQSAVSQTISRIETLLGMKLFERGGAGLALTPAGLQFRYHALRILDSAREAEQAMARYRGVLLPAISICVMETLGDLLGPAIVETLEPSVERVEVVSSVHLNMEEGLVSGRFDAVVTSSEGMTDGADWLELAEEPGVLITPKGFFPGPPDIEALAARLPMARLSSQRRLGRMIDAYLRRITVGAPQRFEFDRVSMIVTVVAAGRGWAITTPLSLLQAQAEAAQLDVHPLPAPGLSRTIVLGAKRGRLLNLPRRLAEQCRARLRTARDGPLARIAPRAVPGVRIAGE